MNLRTLIAFLAGLSLASLVAAERIHRLEVRHDALVRTAQQVSESHSKHNITGNELALSFAVGDLRHLLTLEEQ